MRPIRTLIWNEHIHERNDPQVAQLYPSGIHGTLADALRSVPGIEVYTATLEEPEHGLTEERLGATDVVVWWGHRCHDLVEDAVVDRLQARVLGGMGLVVLHSGHYSKIFKRLMGTSCDLTYREANERERVWVVDPGHPIAAGVGAFIELEHSEMYGEPFGVPTPDEVVFISWFQHGEIFRSGCCWRRGSGRIFYFSPGHQTNSIYHHAKIQRVILNSVRWARPHGHAPSTPREIPLEQSPEFRLASKHL